MNTDIILMSPITRFSLEDKEILSASAYFALYAVYLPQTYDDSKNVKWKIFSHAPDGPHVIYWAIFVKDTTAYLAFRGTTTADDLFVDFSAVPAETFVTNEDDIIEPIYVHGGCKNVVDIELAIILQQLRRVKAENSHVSSLIVTGHSLGAALAQIFAVVYTTLEHHKQPIPLHHHLFTFASPMALWTSKVTVGPIHQIGKSLIINFCNFTDIVPRLFGTGSSAIGIAFLDTQLTADEPALEKKMMRKVLQVLVDAAIKKEQAFFDRYTVNESYSPLAQISYLLKANHKLPDDGVIPPEVVVTRDDVIEEAIKLRKQIDIDFKADTTAYYKHPVITCPMEQLTLDTHRSVAYVSSLFDANLFTDYFKDWVSFISDYLIYSTVLLKLVRYLLT